MKLCSKFPKKMTSQGELIEKAKEINESDD